MHIPTGEIVKLKKSFYGNDEKKWLERAADIRQKFVALSDNEVKTMKPLEPRIRKNIMRNKPCPCGSNKKFKKCCWSKFS